MQRDGTLRYTEGCRALSRGHRRATSAQMKPGLSHAFGPLADGIGDEDDVARTCDAPAGEAGLRERIEA